MYSAKNKKQKQRQQMSDWRKRNPERAREISRGSWLRTTYGISLQDYETLLEAQNGECALCFGSCAPFKVFDVDHDHTSERVRGLLCRKCNIALPEHVDRDWLQRASEYLK